MGWCGGSGGSAALHHRLISYVPPARRVGAAGSERKFEAKKETPRDYPRPIPLPPFPCPELPCPIRLCSRAAPASAANQIRPVPPHPQRAGRAHVIGSFRCPHASRAATGDRSRSALIAASPLCFHRVSVDHQNQPNWLIPAQPSARIIWRFFPNRSPRLPAQSSRATVGSGSAPGAPHPPHR